ncbi:hypothetical protein [Pedobacter ginsengisoli]|uniref:hypothetical protein n=1 Tax=Pedobacter ginsengisoli TaxID=363852 RepID=UPI00254F6D2D|nr:hypothetical protein [Pedobacter ginsengisoli]
MDYITRVEKACKCPEFNKTQSFYKLLPIGKSPNEIEIRLVSHGMTGPNYSIISFDKGKYAAVYYATRYFTQRPSKLKLSPYNRFEIKNKRLDTVMGKLLKLKVSEWKDPGFRITNIADLGVMDIHFKINQDTGSYSFQSPEALLRAHPDVETYQNLNKIVNLFYSITKDARYKDARKRGYRGKKYQ